MDKKTKDKEGNELQEEMRARTSWLETDEKQMKRTETNYNRE